MANYFNPENADDLRLLPKALRSADDLEEIADEVEADILNVYTRALNIELSPGLGWYAWGPLLAYRPATQLKNADGSLTNRWVFLRGYAQDANDSSVDPGLKLALKRAIAEVMRHRIGIKRADPLISSQTDTGQGMSKSFRAEVLEPFPTGWDRWLAPYDTVQPLWGF